MKALLQNPTGGNIGVDIELTDTPIAVVQKAIKQNSAEDVAVIFNSPSDLETFKGDAGQMDKSVSTFNLDSKSGIVPLVWDSPINEQASAEIGEITAAGRDVKFTVAIAMIVA